jgi:hypothetical protein
MRQILIEKYIKPSKTEKIFGCTVELWIDKNGDTHGLMGHPADVWHNIRGTLVSQNWYKKGIHHRDKDLPASIGYVDEITTSRHWVKNGIQHRDNDRPAEIHNSTDGRILLQYWYINGEIQKNKILNKT